MENQDQKSLIEAGVCPNCWGRQAYENEFHKYYRDKTQAELVKDPLGRKAFILKFVEEHVSGIKLKNHVCPACGTGYKKL